MKKNNFKNFAILAMLFLLVGMFCFPANAQAAGKKAVKVKSKTYCTKTYKTYRKVWGLDKKGKVVWTYKTKKRMATELQSSKCVVRKDRVYIFDGSTVKVLKKSNGKKIWTCKKSASAGYQVKFDSKDNLYAIGYYENVLVKINKDGKRMWRKNLNSTGHYWPSKIEISKGRVTVRFDGGHFTTLNTETGKMIATCK